MTASSTRSLGPAPPHGAPLADLRAYLARAYGLPDEYTVDRVVRHGGRAGTALHVHIRPPAGGKHIAIRYEEERQCRSAEALRGQAAADTDGLTRGDLIVGKAAQSVFEALCALADTHEHMSDAAHTWEWLQELLARVDVITGHTLSPTKPDARFKALKALQARGYCKSLVTNPDHDKNGRAIRLSPPLLLDQGDASRWVTARHLAVFVRYDLGVDVTETALWSRLVEVGCTRHQIEQRNSKRTDKVRLVLFRLPADDAGEDGDGDA